MTSKKIFLLIAFAVFAQISLFAQTDWGWDWKDSSKIANKDLPQFNEFLNNQYPYPARPRDMWEIGLGLGVAVLSNDWANDAGLGGSISLRKSFGHIFSIRPYLAYYSNSGGGVNAITNLRNDYQTNSFHIGADVLTSLNTNSHYRGNPKTNIYLISGLEYFSASSKRSIANGPFNSFKNTRNLDNSNFGLNLGLGMAFKLSKSANIGFEFKNTLTNNDYLDTYSFSYSNAFDSWWYGGIRLNYNLGNKSKRIEPLWWINANNFVYSELNSPKHMKVPKVMLPDGDKDGVTDQFDMEPNTPKGAPVDTHGVSKDTDGDGVPDYRDKELLTQQKCFPVNNDGIGNCPEPACCKEIKDMMATYKPSEGEKVNCAIGALPSVQFKGTTKMSKEALAVLSAAAAQLKANPTCNVKVIGYGATSKSAQQQSWERVNAVIKYLVEKQGIAEGRLLFVYAQDGDANTVDLQGTTEQGPNTVPAPHPNLKSRN